LHSKCKVCIKLDCTDTLQTPLSDGRGHVSVSAKVVGARAVVVR
jgi:hypothetical protein